MLAVPLIVASLATADVCAQPRESNESGATSDARARFASGEAAYNRGDYRQAIADWEAAYAADPRPRIQYNLYQAYERLGELGAAAEALQRYLDAADRSDPFYDNAQARMANLQARLQSTGLRLLGGPDGATVRIDERDLGQLPQDVFALEPGQHRVVVSVPGHADFVANVVVTAGQTVEVPVSLEPLPQPEPVAPQAEAPAPTPAPEPAQALATAPAVPAAPALDLRPTRAERAARPFLIGSAVLAGGALLTGIWALNRDAVLEGCSDPAFFCPRSDTVRGERTIAAITSGTLGAGAVGLFVYGLVLRLRHDEPEREAGWSCGAGPGTATCSLRF